MNWPNSFTISLTLRERGGRERQRQRREREREGERGGEERERGRESGERDRKERERGRERELFPREAPMPSHCRPVHGTSDGVVLILHRIFRIL